MSPAPLRETDLYPPVKLMLEGQGYVVKGEIGAADIVALRDGEEPVVVELKTKFSLSLFHQAVQRQALTDAVYVAVPRGEGRPFMKALADNRVLCRRLGLGLITVRMQDGCVEIHCDPTAYRPRQSKPRKARLLREFARRVGDPTSGGATRVGLVTAYRQDALLCLKVLELNGPTKAAEVARQARVKHARRLMADDHYGWFERVAPGIYDLTPKGRIAVTDYAGELERLDAAIEQATGKDGTVDFR